MALFDPKTFTYDQLNALTNTPGESLATSNTPEQIKSAQSLTMTPESLADANPIKIPDTTPEITPDISSLQSQLDTTYAPTQAEKQYSTVSSDLLNTYNQLVGITPDTQQLQESLGQNKAQATYDELAQQLNASVAEQKAIPVSVESAYVGREVPASIVSAKTNQALRQNAIKALGLSALMDAAKGQLNSAINKVDQAIAAKYDPIRAKQAALEAQLNLIKNDPATSLQDKKRADARLAIQEQIKAQTELKATNEKSVREIMLLAAKYGATPDEISAIGTSKTPMEAIIAAGQRLQDPAAKLELESKRLDIAIKSANLRKLTSPTGTVSAANKALAPTLRDKIKLIDELKASKGLKSSVGPSPITRFAVLAGVTGAKQDFIAGVQQLISQDTLNTLLNLKAQGGTLGALSEGEGQLLRSAASKIGSWTVKNADGEVTGYNTSENSFRKELDKIKELTQRALDNAQQDVLAPDEQAALDEYFGTSSSGLSPENYFQ